MSVPKIKAQGKVIDLNQNHYKGAGGEGVIYVKGGYAYKIYHDPAKMIPVGKIQELAKLNLPNVLGPLFPITDTHDKPVGFAMKYAGDTEYLCKLFTKGFRDTNGVDPSMINALVKRAQDTLKAIHAHKTLVVDYNELNFLTSKSFDEIFHIDVDCYQTPSYPATAIMASIKDPQVKNNKFTELSDWFSAAIIFFQMYMGTHPYKGRHPDHGKDWQARMAAGVSVFNKKATLPPNTQDWSVVPKGHLKWFEKVFEHGERCAPPEPDHVLATAGAVVPQIVNSTSKFSLKLVRAYDSPVLALRYIGGVAYAYTEKSIYADDRIMASHAPASGFVARRTQHDFVYAQNSTPVVLEYNGITGELKWETIDGKYKGELAGSSYFIANDRLYVVTNGNLVEYSFMNLGAKVLAAQQIVGNIFQSHQSFDGLIAQDILGTARLTFSVQPTVSATVHVKELDKARIVAGKLQNGVAVLIAEHGGKLARHTICFDKTAKEYTIRTETDASLQDVQLVVLDKGIAVTSNQDTIELFVDNSKIKVVDDSPITNNQRLYSFKNDIFLVNKNELHQVSMR